MCFNLPFSLRHGSACFLLLSVKHLCGDWRAGAAGSWLGVPSSPWLAMGTGKAESHGEGNGLGTEKAPSDNAHGKYCQVFICPQPEHASLQRAGEFL